MKFCELTETEFDTFSKEVSCKNFFQSLETLKRYKNNKEEVYLVGVKDNDKVVAASILVAYKESKYFNYKTFNAYKGFLMDYSNNELLKFFTKEIKKFIRSKKGFRLYIDPYIVSEQRDTDGKVVEGGINNLSVKESLLTLGYHYIGEYTQVKWNYCLDIQGKTKEELFKTFKPNTRNNINKTLNKYLLNVRKLTLEELPLFKKVTEDTCARRGFKDKTLKYYQDMYKAFKDKVVFYICELDCDKYIANLEKEIESANERIIALSDSPSNKNRKLSLAQEVKGNTKRIEEAKAIKKEKGNIVPLSAAMFILWGDEVVYLFSGSYDEYMSFCGQYRLQWEIISYACDNHYSRYNFYGIKDLFNPQGKDYGVYEFKKGFSGYVEELLGAFVIPTNLLGKIIYLIKK